MKYPLLLMLTLTIYSSSIAQERDNTTPKPLPVISDEVYGRLDSATGWLNNSSGQWVSRPNKIVVNLDSSYKDLLDYEEDGLGIDNFVNYELRKLTVKDSTYYILLKTYKTGRYQYPSLKQDWYDEKNVLLYLFSVSEIDKLKLIKPGELQLIKIPVLYWGGADWDSKPQDYLNELVKKMDGQTIDDKKHAYMQLCINLQVLPERNIARFIIFTMTKYSIADQLKGEGIIKNTPDNLKKCYYETTLTNFQNLFKDLTVAQQ